MTITTVDVGPLGDHHRRLWRGARLLYLLIPIPMFMALLVQTGLPVLDHILFFGGPIVLLAAFATALFVSGRFVARWGTVAGWLFGLFVTVNLVIVADKFVPALLDGSLFDAGVLGTNLLYLASLLGIGSAARAGLLLGKASIPALGVRFVDILANTRRRAGHGISSTAPLAFRARPSGWLRIACGFGLFGLAFWLFVLDQAFPALGLGNVLPPDVYLPASVAGFALVALGGTLLVRHGLRQVRLDAHGQMEADVRPPVLLLRSFPDDQASLRPVGLLAFLQLRRRRLEEAVAQEVSALGPFIAVGAPGERLPELGAYRAYPTDGEWQAAVLDWINRSRAVLLVAGTTPWVAWELRALRKAAALPKLLLLLPPGKAEDRDARWRIVGDCLRDSRWGPELAHADPTRAIALCFRPDGGIVVIAGSTETERDCRLAVRVGLYAMLAPHPSRHPIGQDEPDQAEPTPRRRTGSDAGCGRSPDRPIPASCRG